MAKPQEATDDAQLTPTLHDLREEVTQLRTFAEASPVGMAYLDADLRYREVNPAMAAVNGLPQHEHVGR
jgi:PAS domain-containing protein